MPNLLFNWRQFIEIIILWSVIYQFILFFEGTRGSQVLRGIIVLFLASFLFQKLNFTVLDWLLQQLFGISVIVLLVIFHPEIRQGLAKLGKRRIFNIGLKAEELDLMLDEIGQACENLSRNKIGALIVLERADPLTSYLQSGVNIDANVSSELIQAIFAPNNLLHDGAIILQHNRISAAGCILPLTSKQEISRLFGTRHRAALGLSEETDAIVIVVSEERQDISLVYKGKLHKDLGQEELKIKIREIFKIK
ncbi:MAG: diadenylate cyclase CdaA [Candidatus Omnitrophica bacterium]|jgi:diadenylate cyclase|nr:diadenylate cyclase CdaA [Candidatus Omnitrophota bacterium]